MNFCVLDLDTKFKDFENKKCRRPEFFEKILREDWGTVYQRPYNWFSRGKRPQSDCGPYFVYILDRIPLERIYYERDSRVRRDGSFRGQDTSRESKSTRADSLGKSVEKPISSSPSIIWKTNETIRIGGWDDFTDGWDVEQDIRLEHNGRSYEGRVGVYSSSELGESGDLFGAVSFEPYLDENKRLFTPEKEFDGHKCVEGVRMPSGNLIYGPKFTYVRRGDKFTIREGSLIYELTMKDFTTKYVRDAFDPREEPGESMKPQTVFDDVVVQLRIGIEPVYQCTPVEPVQEARSDDVPPDTKEAKKRQNQTARYLGLPVKKIDLGNGITMEFVFIPAGEFMMGSPSNERGLNSDEGPQHRVRISKGFYMGQTEVTQGQYRAVMGSEPWSGKSYVQQSYNNPAVYVSWDDALEFCKKLTQKESRTYRLPTEAEWEYAC